MADRDEKTGRFLPGNSASTGRPTYKTERNILRLFDEHVSDADWIAIIKRAVKDAKNGNGYARAWLSDYGIGRPPQILELRGAEAKELAELLELFKQQNIEPSAVFNAMIAEVKVAHESG